jgi:uncharacterized membrane protein
MIAIEILKVFFGFVFFVFIPGACIYSIAFKDKKNYDFVYGIGVSLLIGVLLIIVSGTIFYMILNSFNYWFFCIISLSSIIVLFVQKFHRNKWLFNNPEIHINKSSLLVFLGIVILLTLGFLTGQATTKYIQFPKNYYTEFYVLDELGKIPSNLNAIIVKKEKIQIGVISHEQRIMNYKVVVHCDNKTIFSTNEFLLNPEQTWTTEILISDFPANENKNQRLFIDLYNDSTVYRQLHLDFIQE